MTAGSLFSGIGGFDLGLERAGFKVKWQVEIDDYCRKVLTKHWPTVLKYTDIRDCGAHNLEPVDLICGGFPCQPFSNAGKRKGKDDDRYLWPEMLRVISELKPHWVIGENVAGIVSMGLDTVLSDLEGEGYETGTFIIPACAVYAPHRRDRVWILAYSGGTRRKKQYIATESNRQGFNTRRSPAPAFNSTSKGFPDWSGGEVGQPRPVTEFERPDGREIERDFRGIYHGVFRRVDRLKGLGNAIVPQIPEIFGRMILEIESDRLVPGEKERPR